MNPQVVIGGAAASVPRTGTHGTSATPGIQIFDPTGTTVIETVVGSNSWATGTQYTGASGSKVTIDASGNATIQLPSGWSLASPGTGYLYAAETSTFGPYSGVFDIASATGTRRFGPFTAVNSLLTETGSRGGLALASRTVLESLFSEGYSNGAGSHAGGSVTEMFLSESAARAANLAARTCVESFVFSSAARSGRVAPAGTTAPPIATAEPALFSQSASRGPVAFAARSAVNSLCTETGGRGARSYAIRAALDFLLTESAPAQGGFAHAINPAGTDNRDPFVVLRLALAALLTLKGSPLSIATVTLSVLDKIAASYRTNEVNQTASILANLPTLIRGGDGITSTVYGYGSDQPILTLLPAAEAILAASAPNVVQKALYSNLMSAVQTLVSKLGYTSLDAYATAINSGTRYSFLVHPNLALINWLYNNQVGTLLLSPGNVFAPQTLFGMATVGAGAGVVTYTDVNTIPTANVVSPVPGASTQGYTPAPGLSAQVTTAIGGTLTLTVISSGWDANGNVVTGRTWTGTLSSLAAGASAALSPAVTGDRISHITGASGSGTATSGAFTLNSVLERTVS